MNMFIGLYFLVLSLFSVSAFADGLPSPAQISLQSAATDLMSKLTESHYTVTVIMAVIMLLVWAVMLYIIFRFRQKPGVEPSSCSHNVMLEILWTVVPLIVVGFLTVKNVDLIKFQNTIPKTDMTLKVVGYQWYWGYEYIDQGVKFESYMKPDSDLAPGEPRLLSVDNVIVLPINTNIKLQTTASDVIHSWAVPAFGVKVDAVPGRLNERWFNIKKPGVYYGQCSELCGRMHGFMPIVVRAVSKQDFEKWLLSKKVSS